VHQNDGTAELEWVARKCAALRIFADEQGKMNRSVVDVGGEALVVSQFTLYGNVERGNRPSFVESAHPDTAIPLYERFVEMMSSLLGRPVETGEFGAMMQVELVNDGPVTIAIERTPTS
jgi:D-tyrosyl-tRNA(Tyr) deacylase